METLSLKDVEMPETIENGLSILLGGIGFSLKLNQKILKVINRYGAIFGVLIKQVLYIFRRLSHLEPKYSLEAEADLERLLIGHF